MFRCKSPSLGDFCLFFHIMELNDPLKKLYLKTQHLFLEIITWLKKKALTTGFTLCMNFFPLPNDMCQVYQSAKGSFCDNKLMFLHWAELQGCLLAFLYRLEIMPKIIPKWKFLHLRRLLENTMLSVQSSLLCTYSPQKAAIKTTDNKSIIKVRIRSSARRPSPVLHSTS